MLQNRRGWIQIVGCLICLLGLVGTAFAQEGGLGSVIFITDSDSSSAPIVDLSVYGLDAQGVPLTLSPEDITISHGGIPVTDIQIVGEKDAGTFTVFVIDTPPGVSAQLGTIQLLLEQFASLPTMQESLDYVAVYQVGASDATQLLAPATFYNEVKNLFVEPLQTQTGPTALIDSMGNLITNIESLKPQPQLATSIVLMTDGTDVVSTQFQEDAIVSLAADKGIPIHTIHLDNVNLGQSEEGLAYLKQVSQGSRGVAGSLVDAGTLNIMWNRITSLRERIIVRYTVPNPTSGSQTVLFSLTDEPTATAQTSVAFETTAPSIVMNLPPESRTLTLDSLDDPITLRLSATVTWLDETTREIMQAQLFVNGSRAIDIEPNSLASFEAELTQLQYGTNTLQIFLADDQGSIASSPAIDIEIVQGETQLPPDLEADSGIGVIGVVAGIFIVFLLLMVGAVFILSRRGDIDVSKTFEGITALLHSYRSPQEEPLAEQVTYVPTSDSMDDAMPQAAYLEVLESVTRMPEFLALHSVETRIGRSPAQADLTFENDITVSRLHASIILSEGEYRLYDEQSTSGTLINEQPVPEYGVALSEGDEIRFGAVRVVFRFG